MRQDSNAYIIGFATAVCLVCSIVVSTSAVALRERQDRNKVLDRQTQVLVVAGLLEAGQKTIPENVEQLFEENIQIRVIDLATGEYEGSVESSTYDQRKATKDPAASRSAPVNNAGLSRLPTYALVYQRVEDGDVQSLILPIEGKGLWSTLYGFIALAPDPTTIQGITFYEHGETPGLAARSTTRTGRRCGSDVGPTTTTGSRRSRSSRALPDLLPKIRTELMASRGRP